ncbi:MAG: transcriptional repressor [Prevotella sp.]|nr:transcriptional repressor [Prevotella sp.]
MMEKRVRDEVKQILMSYLETNKRRKTPERFAILDAIYSMRGHFTIEQLSDYLDGHHFHVSRATLYNSIKLFYELRLVIPHHLQEGTMYEACYVNGDHIHQICTVCGKVTEVKSPTLMAAIEETKLKRFRKNAYSLNIYGICSTCQAKITRMKGKAHK